LETVESLSIHLVFRLKSFFLFLFEKILIWGFYFLKQVFNLANNIDEEESMKKVEELKKEAKESAKNKNRVKNKKFKKLNPSFFDDKYLIVFRLFWKLLKKTQFMFINRLVSTTMDQTFQFLTI
jgi:hypothetical protein